ncbi:FtsX-like permease family protein [Pirellulimonas nuda]|uniref:FtsX-like permease family protein n=1 Tax=Pirellulimonas nuda TaxID=2528009 RepID=A0A518DIM3_9BACT|nr:FtsX-like permease family protein [Pirellulimonas nuda]QDU91333.1 FtsX-like permease family protein [Pirellulimonas nuda]
MLTALDRKLLRDLGQMAGQVVMIALVIGAGVAALVNNQTMLRSLEATREAFYDRYRFADVFANVKRAPDSLADRIADIPGVALVETRIVEGVNLSVPGLDEPAVGQIISMRTSTPPLLNQVYLRRGRMLAPRRDDEVLASEKFVNENNLRVGDEIVAILNGTRKPLRIVGVVLSPEYVFQIKPGDLVPDPKHYGVLWMDHDVLAMAYDMEGAFNDVSAELLRGADLQDVLFRMDKLIRPYGGRGAYGRKDQVSHMLLESDIQGLKTMGLVAPSIFLAVAAFLVNVVLTRMLSLQREQIAALKAFGYSNVEVGWHYLKFVLLIAIVGAAIGTIGGVWLSRGFTEMIARVYQYPELLFAGRWGVVGAAGGVAIGASVLGAISAVWQAVRLPPAEAMRPEPPASFRPTLIERLGLGRFTPNVVKMILRQLERQPVKTAFSVLAIATAIGIVVVGNFIRDSIDFVLDLQFRRVQQYDLQIALAEPLSRDMVYELQHLPGVWRVEPTRGVSANLVNGRRHRRIGMLAMESGATLTRTLDRRGAAYAIPPGGLVLSRSLGRSLDLGAGDTVRVEILEGKRPIVDLPVVALLDDVAGLNAFLSLDQLSKLMREGPRANGAVLTIDPATRDEVYRQLKEVPMVAGVTVKNNALVSFQETIAKNLGFMRVINLSFAIIIAVGVVYNGARIALSERSRELATLRVIGFTRGEISAILLGELGVVTLMATPLGLLMGYYMAWALAYFMDQEVFRFPLVVSRATFGLAASVVLAASLASGLIVRRRLDELDLIAVLKSRS